MFELYKMNLNNLRIVHTKYGEIWKYSKKDFNVVKWVVFWFCSEKGCPKCVKCANNVIWWVSFWKFVRGLFIWNDRLHRHFGKHSLNFDARSILST